MLHLVSISQLRFKDALPVNTNFRILLGAKKLAKHTLRKIRINVLNLAIHNLFAIDAIEKILLDAY